MALWGRSAEASACALEEGEVFSLGPQLLMAKPTPGKGSLWLGGV